MHSEFSTRQGSELWDKASSLIPGANMLLSKNKNLFSPGLWPCYYSSCKGAFVWDLDGNEYLDFCSNGVGACSLGHAYEPVDNAAIEAIRMGVMSSLNTPKEVELAQKLIELHPWADMVRFARTGGEANAIAIRIARAYTSKDKVAICGYHGWHDWYLAANLDSHESLNTHLLEGLNPLGVPEGLTGTIVPLRFNNFDDLDLLLDSDIGALKMEVARTVQPALGYLERIRQICNERGIVLIFDECTTGFRQQLGGLHKQYGVFPDMCMFGKALGNGYAISAVIGKQHIMEFASKTFISSTFWTEAVGPAAALETLRQMEILQSFKQLPLLGSAVKGVWKSLSLKHGVPISIFGIDALPTFVFETSDPLAFKTAFVEQMLKEGFLATNSFYPTIAHNFDHIHDYEKALDKTFLLLSTYLDSTKSIADICSSVKCSPTFQRLN